ncbi:hypothetical protein D3C81_1748170 [compost metagenome]
MPFSYKFGYDRRKSSRSERYQNRIERVDRIVNTKYAISPDILQGYLLQCSEQLCNDGRYTKHGRSLQQP